MNDPRPHVGALAEGAAGQAPAPISMPMVYDTLDAALDALDLSRPDRAALQAAVAAVGLPDPSLGDRIGVDRVSVETALRDPLHTTPPDRIPADGSRAWFQSSTAQLPSGRVWQIQRRYPGEAELAVALRPGGRLTRPSVWLRELLLPPQARRDPAVVQGFGLATIDDEPVSGETPAP